jgi:Mechanosensitive ion channel
MSTGMGYVLLAMLVLGAPAGAFAQPATRPESSRSTTAPNKPETTSTAYPQTPEQVMASLNRAMNWYRQSRIAMRSVDTAGVFGRSDEQTAVRLLGRAFDAARASAAVLDRQEAGSSGTSSTGGQSAARAKLQAAIRQDEQEVGRLRSRLQAEPERRAALERALMAANNRLELDKARLEFLTQLRGLSSPDSSSDDDLEHQIEGLREAVPELNSPTAAPAAAAAPSPSASGTWAMIQRLLALQRSRSSLESLESATNGLVRHVDDDLKTVRASIRPIMTRLRELAKDPTDSVSSLKDSQREFRDLLERRKLVAAVVLPLREESALARRFAADLKGWSEVIDHESRLALQSLGVDLLGVLVALAVIFIGGALWRVAVSRYVTDAGRRRVLLTARSIVVSVAVALVLIFHFTSEMTALVTALGFAAAGVAFALQNVILAVAGYFTMVAPNGIRVGDRVSLQGPFGYVHGEVDEIGFVRIKLRELIGDPLKPSGRVVVFPNSVVFTGSFFKDPASPRTS